MDYRTVEQALRAQGWRIQIGSDQHRRFYSPTGQYVTDYANTSSSQTRLRNTVAALRRAGLIYPMDRKALKAAERRACVPGGTP